MGVRKSPVFSAVLPIPPVSDVEDAFLVTLPLGFPPMYDFLV